MGPSEDVTRLSQHIERRYPSVRAKVTTFTSGAAVLYVHCADRLFVVAYLPSWGFGVDEVKDDEGIGTWYRHRFEDIESAKRKLVSMLETAIPHTQQA